MLKEAYVFICAVVRRSKPRHKDS